MSVMKLSPTSLRWFRSSVGAAVLTVGMMNAGAMVVAPLTEFEGIDCGEMIAAYKQAYIKAGFTFEKQTIQKSIGHTFTMLVFRFQIPEYRGKQPGIASFKFDSREPKDPDRVSCSANRQIFSAGDESYTSEEWNVVNARMVSADNKATAQVRKKLGKSLPAMK